MDDSQPKKKHPLLKYLFLYLGVFSTSVLLSFLMGMLIFNVVYAVPSAQSLLDGGMPIIEQQVLLGNVVEVSQGGELNVMVGERMYHYHILSQDEAFRMWLGGLPQGQFGYLLGPEKDVSTYFWAALPRSVLALAVLCVGPLGASRFTGKAPKFSWLIGLVILALAPLLHWLTHQFWLGTVCLTIGGALLVTLFPKRYGICGAFLVIALLLAALYGMYFLPVMIGTIGGLWASEGIRAGNVRCTAFCSFFLLIPVFSSLGCAAVEVVYLARKRHQEKA